MLRLRLGLRLGPFVLTSSPRRRPRVPSVPGTALWAVAYALAFPAGIALAWWLS